MKNWGLTSFILWVSVTAWPSGLVQMMSTPAVRFLTSDRDAVDYWPTFSPDGKVVLFSRTTDKKTWDLFIVPVDGGEAHTLSRSRLPVSATRASWSTRNNLIAFTGTSADGNNTVWLINADGTQPRQLVAAGLSEQVFYPSWYPDGDALAVVDAKDYVIKRIDRDRLTVVPVTDHSQVLTGMPSVSPDGRWVAFAGQSNNGQAYDQTKNSIWIAGDTKVARPVEAVPGQGRTPAWAPDSQWLAFESNRGSTSNQRYAVFTINRDGTTLRQITPYELDANHPAWSPNGGQLVFSARHTKESDATGIAVVDIKRQ
jgi:Tol biopolymer transport system component